MRIDDDFMTFQDLKDPAPIGVGNPGSVSPVRSDGVEMRPTSSADGADALISVTPKEAARPHVAAASGRVVPVLVPKCVICGHPVAVHSDQGCLEFFEDGDGYCFCYRTNLNAAKRQGD